MFKNYFDGWKEFLGTPSMNIIGSVLKLKKKFVCLVILSASVAASLEGISFSFLMVAFMSFADPTTVRNQIISATQKMIPQYESLVLAYLPQNLFFTLIVLAILFQLIRAFIQYLGIVASADVTSFAVVHSRQKVFEQIFALSYPIISKYKIGHLTELAYLPTRSISFFLNQSFQVVMNLSVCLVYLCLLTLISLQLTLLAAILLLPAIFVYKAVTSKIRASSLRLTEAHSLLSQKAVDSLGALKMIHSFGVEQQIYESVSEILDQTWNTQRKENILAASINPAIETLLLVALGLFILFSRLVLSDNSLLSTAQLLTFILILYRFSGKLQAAVASLSMIGSVTGPFRELNAFLLKDQKVFTPTDGLKVKLNSGITFANVTFKYEGTHSPALSEINLQIKKGATTAFVGPSGAGKTSLIDLLLLNYPPTEGQILVDGTDLALLHPVEWRNQIGSVGQDPVLLNDTIAANLRLVKSDASLEEIRKAAQLAHIDKFVMELPKGYDTIVGERGFRLSGGQRQRIALARALIREPEILILDEATSALDSESERIIQTALKDFSRRKTLVVIAHRLSTIRGADEIFVLDQGRIVEQGSHSTLVEKRGKYLELWKQQQFDLSRYDHTLTKTMEVTQC